MDNDYTRNLPKIDLHRHFDGDFSPEHLYLEAQRRGLPQAKLTQEEFIARCRVGPTCRSLTEFLAVFEFFYAIAQDRDFLFEEARKLPAKLAAAGIIYAETRFAPHLFVKEDFSADEVVQTVLEGLAAGHGSPVRVILCVMRGAPLEHLGQVIALYEKFCERGVCGIDLAGDESRYACREYAPLFARARDLGIPVTIHAGEAAGPQSMRDALDLFGARRIGHGIRAVEDPELVRRLAQQKIPLEVCLTSNLQTGNAASYHEHPFPQLLAAGVPVTLNTDDPSVSGIELDYEWQQAIAHYALSPQAQKQILLNAAEAAFCDNVLKEKLKQKILDFL